MGDDDWDCELTTLTGEPCRAARRAVGGGTTRIGNRHFCRKHHDALVHAVLSELEDNRTSDLARQVRRAVHHWDAEASAAAEEAAFNRRQEMKKDAFVYYAERDGFIKIGMAWDVQQRMAALALGGVLCPPGMRLGPVNLLASHKGGQQAEAAMHRRFRAHRVVGEWFHPAPELLTHIAEVASASTSAR